MHRVLSLLAIATISTCAAAEYEGIASPLFAPEWQAKSPTDYLLRALENGTQYDPEPRIVEVDAKSGRHELTWIGYDGEKKTVIWHRPDRIELTVVAEVSKGEARRYRYTYTFALGTRFDLRLGMVFVQSFDSDVVTFDPDYLFTGQAGRHVPDWSDGYWRTFAANYETYYVQPGDKLTVWIESDSAPTLVRCMAMGGSIVIKGVGEEMPMGLENSIPGRELWPRGITIGPGPSGSVSPDYQVASIFEHEAELVAAGWISADNLIELKQLYETSDSASALLTVVDWAEKGRIAPDLAVLAK